MKWKHILIILLLLPAVAGFGQSRFIISGVILDSESGKALKGINVVVEDQNTGTISTQKGTFLLHLAEGEYNLTVSGKGYKEKEMNISLTNNLEKDISLSPSKANTKKKKHSKKHLMPQKHQLKETLLSLL